MRRTLSSSSSLWYVLTSGKSVSLVTNQLRGIILGLQVPSRSGQPTFIRSGHCYKKQQLLSEMGRCIPLPFPASRKPRGPGKSPYGGKNSCVPCNYKVCKIFDPHNTPISPGAVILKAIHLPLGADYREASHQHKYQTLCENCTPELLKWPRGVVDGDAMQILWFSCPSPIFSGTLVRRLAYKTERPEGI